MQIKFEDIKIKKPKRCNKSPLEITLFEGIEPSIAASFTPSCYGRDKKSDKPGISIVGYAFERTDDHVALASGRLSDSGQPASIGGIQVYKEAIHSIWQLD